MAKKLQLHGSFPSKAGDPGKSAYEIAKDNGFEGTEVEWLESLKGIQGPTGVTPNLTIGDVITSPSGNALASITGTPENPVLNLALPKGVDGKDGVNGTSITVSSVSESAVDGGDNIVAFSDGKTVTIKNGSTGQNGVSVTHEWDGTTLKVTSASGISSADLKGSKGDDGNGIASAVLNADYTLTLTFDDGTSYTTPSIRGATGATGGTGKDGNDGEDGVGIASIEQTTTSTTDGGDNIFTVTLTNGTSATFTVKNGSTGTAGKDGEDYVLTSADKTEIAELTKSLIPLSDYPTTEQADEKYQPKGNYLTGIPAGYVTDAELATKGFATQESVDLLRATVDNMVGVEDVESTITYIPPSGTAGGHEAIYTGYYDTEGKFVPTGSFRGTPRIPINANSVVKYKCNSYTTLCSVAFYDKDGAFISGIVGTDSNVQITGTASVPAGARWVSFSFLKADPSQYGTVTVTKTGAMTATEEQYTLNNLITGSFYDTSGNIVNSDKWCRTPLIPISSETTINYYVVAYSATVSFLAFYDVNKQFISGKSAASGTQYGVIIAPSNARYVGGSAYSTDTNTVFNFSPFWTEASEATTAAIMSNPLYGKILAATGDSITRGYETCGSYANIIATENSMEYECKAIWGAVIPTGLTIDGTTLSSIYSTISAMRDDADYIILSGGVNDFDHMAAGNETLGAITNGYNASFDTTTYLGALEAMLRTAILKWPGKKILFVITHRFSDYGSDLGNKIDTTYLPKTVEVLEKWGIPYVDLYHKTPTLKRLEALQNAYTRDYEQDGTGDGLHPNYEGYKLFYCPKVEAMMKSI